jgi:hypothetical protein
MTKKAQFICDFAWDELQVSIIFQKIRNVKSDGVMIIGLSDERMNYF